MGSEKIVAIIISCADRTFQAGGSSSAILHNLFNTGSVTVFNLSRPFTETQSVSPKQTNSLSTGRKLKQVQADGGGGGAANGLEEENNRYLSECDTLNDLTFKIFQ